MPKMKKFWIYIAGIVPLAFFYEGLKSRVSGPIFLVSAIIYLVLLRLIAEKFGK